MLHHRPIRHKLRSEMVEDTAGQLISICQGTSSVLLMVQSCSHLPLWLALPFSWPEALILPVYMLSITE